MATKYIHKFASTAAFIAAAADRTLAQGIGAVSDIFYINVAGVAKALIDASTAQTMTNKTLASPVINTPTISAPVISGAGSVTGLINTDVKSLAADFAAASGDTGSTLTSLTGFSWTLVAGATYKFRMAIPKATQTANGGAKLAFKLTTATLTSINLRVRASTDTDNTGAVSTNFTTTTDQAAWVDQKTAVYTNYVIEGSFIVNAGGTIAVQAAQNTAHVDTTTIVAGAFAQLERVL